MNSRRIASPSLALLLIAALLAMRISTLTTEFFVIPYQDFIKDTPTIYSGNSHCKPGTTTFKPKRAFDLDCFEPESLPSFLLVSRRIVPYFPFVAIPEVYPDIFIPPDCLS